jgi:flagellar basal body-associated protein FliL
MELLPQDPKKKLISLIAIGVIGIAAVVVIAMQVFGGESVPNDPAAAAQQAGEQPPPEDPKAPEVGRGGSRQYRGPN